VTAIKNCKIARINSTHCLSPSYRSVVIFRFIKLLTPGLSELTLIHSEGAMSNRDARIGASQTTRKTDLVTCENYRK